MLESVTYSDVSNPRWANAEKTRIDLQVNFSHLPEESVNCSVCSANTLLQMGKSVDSEPYYITELYEKAKAGEFGTIAEWVDEELVYQDPFEELLGGE